MSKQEFIERLQKGLQGLPQDEIEERIMFYTEMIEDRIEEGFTEEEAVSEIGNIEEIISQVVADTPLAKLVKEKITPKKRLAVWEIILLVLGSPIWLSLLLVVIAVILTLYIVVWSVAISLWSVWGSLVACAFAGIVAGSALSFDGNIPAGLVVVGGGIVCAGLSIFVFYGCKMATKGILMFTKKFAIWIKKCFVKKEEA